MRSASRRSFVIANQPAVLQIGTPLEREQIESLWKRDAA